MTSLSDEITELDAAIAVARIDQVRLVARIEGLQAQRDALQRALSTPQPTRSGINIAAMTKADAIVAILRAAPKPMTLGDIAEAMTLAGKKTTANGVSVYINDLLGKNGRSGRVTRVTRGHYVASEETA